VSLAGGLTEGHRAGRSTANCPSDEHFERGGTERQMVELACRLYRYRFRVHIICFRRDGPRFARVGDAVEDSSRSGSARSDRYQRSSSL
jgi:hypothetical protein